LLCKHHYNDLDHLQWLANQWMHRRQLLSQFIDQQYVVVQMTPKGYHYGGAVIHVPCITHVHLNELDDGDHKLKLRLEQSGISPGTVWALDSVLTSSSDTTPWPPTLHITAQPCVELDKFHTVQLDKSEPQYQSIFADVVYNKEFKWVMSEDWQRLVECRLSPIGGPWYTTWGWACDISSVELADCTTVRPISSTKWCQHMDALRLGTDLGSTLPLVLLPIIMSYMGFMPMPNPTTVRSQFRVVDSNGPDTTSTSTTSNTFAQCITKLLAKHP